MLNNILGLDYLFGIVVATLLSVVEKYLIKKELGLYERLIVASATFLLCYNLISSLNNL